MNIAIAYLLTLLVFAVIDTAWLGSMGDRLYRPLIGPMLAENFRLAPARQRRAFALSIGVQKGPPIGVQKGPPSSSSVTGMTGAPFALVAA